MASNEPSQNVLASDPAVSVAQQALDALMIRLSSVAAQAGVASDATDAAVQVRPASLARVGRSRREGALLDLELTVTITVTDPKPLPLLEALLLAAESMPHTAIGPLPAGQRGLGFTLALLVTVPIAEPSGPRVTETVIEIHPLSNLSGQVVDGDGRGVPAAEVTSTITRQRVSTTSAGGFQMLATGRPVTLTATKGGRSASVNFEPGSHPVRIVLPEGS